MTSKKKKILYLSCFPTEVFLKFIKDGKNISQAAQKFNHLFVEGFCYNGFDVDVIVICSKETVFNEIISETVNNQIIKFYPIVNEGSIIERVFSRKIIIRKQIDKFKNEKYTCVVIDALKPGALELSKICKKCGLPVSTIITDFVEFLSGNPRTVIDFIRFQYSSFLFYRQFKYTDVFILLTEQMLNKINVGNRKYCIIDGLCDKSESNENIDNDCTTNDERTNKIVYTGAISRQFGLDNLVKGFIEANLPDAELDIYGRGDYVLELKDICQRYPKVKFFKPIPNEEIIKVQKQAKFLVNPRPVSDEYVKYSFPSKNIEYMTSGRPVITTKLPCITKDYYPYLYFFSDDSTKGISKTLQELYFIDEKILKKKGKEAKTFVEKNKNNHVQVMNLLHRIQE